VQTIDSVSHPTLARLRPNRRQAIAQLTGLMFLLLAAIVLWHWHSAAFPVLLEIDGQQARVQTSAASPQAMLHKLGYDLHPQDDLQVTGSWGANAHVILQRARPVQVEADDRSQVVWTRAQNVVELLADAGLAVGPGDEIFLNGDRSDLATKLPSVQWQPPSGLRTAKPWQQVAVPLQLSIVRAIPVQVKEENGVTRTIWTRADTVAQALEENDITVYEGDDVLPGLDAPVQPGMLVLVRRSSPVTIVVDGQTIAARTRAQTVGEALRDLGIMVQGEDIVHPSLTAKLRPNSTINITRVAECLEYEEELLPFDTIWQPDDNLLIDTRRVGSEGQPGILRRRYRVRYEDGKEVSRELEDEWVAQEPKRKVILYGRKIVPRTAMTPDGPITYWRKIRAYTTSYSPARSGTDPSLPWYGHTRLGFKAGKGVVGVDPSVINMSQKLYVPGYGFAIAGDTGSGLSGRHVDLGFSDDDYESWHWWSDVYLLWPPPPDYAINWVLPDWPRYKGSRNPFTGLVQEEP